MPHNGVFVRVAAVLWDDKEMLRSFLDDYDEYSEVMTFVVCPACRTSAIGHCVEHREDDAYLASDDLAEYVERLPGGLAPGFYPPLLTRQQRRALERAGR